MKTIFTLVLAGLVILIDPLYGQSIYEVYVSSRGTNSVKKYAMSGTYLGDFVAPGEGGLTSTEDILFHPDGSVLVTGFGNSAIKRYDGITGGFLGNFSSGYSLSSPSKMSIGPDSLIYVTQWGITQNEVVRFSLEGDFIDEFTSTGAPKGLGHVWDEEKNFYIALFGTGGDGTIHKFDSIGNDLGTFINSTVIQGPTSIWFDTDGSMLVEDWTLGNVYRFNDQGENIGIFIQGMTNPEGIAVTQDGNLLIGDWGLDVVHMFSASGEDLGDFTSGNGLLDPNSVKIRETTMTSVQKLIKEDLSLQVYPTLSSEQIFIQFELQHPENIVISVTDLRGRVIHTVSQEVLETGIHHFKWIPDTKTADGLYLIHMQAGDYHFAERVIIKR